MTFNGQQCLGFEFQKKLPANNALIFPLTEKQLTSWLLTLPMLNVMEASERLERYLLHINQITLPDKQRLMLLEGLRPTIDVLMGIFVKDFRGHVIDLSIRGQELYRLVSSLNQAMAEGYKFLLYQRAIKQPNWMTRKQYTLLVVRVLFYLSEQLRLSYLLYATEPFGVWHDMHRCYSYAEKLRLHRNGIKEKLGFERGERITASKIYKRLLLLAMISPISLKSAQLEQVYRGLNPLVDKITIIVPDDSTEFNSAYLINYQSDSGPTNAREPSQLHNKHIWLINNDELIEQLQSWLDGGEYKNSEQGIHLSKELLSYLIFNLKAHPEYVNNRVATEETIKALVGLSQIEKMLTTEEEALLLEQQTDSSERHNQESNSKLWGEKDDHDVWDELQFLAIDDPAVDEPPKEKAEKETSPVSVYSWHVNDKSPNGYGLCCQLDDDDLLSVGELLLLQPDERSEEDSTDAPTKGWQLGTICWMQSEKMSNTVNLGVYILAQHVKKIHVVKLDGHHHESEACLLLDDIGTEMTPSILISRKFANTGDVLLIKSHGELQKVHIDKVVWNSEGFAQFHFHLYNDQDEVKSILSGL